MRQLVLLVLFALLGFNQVTAQTSVYPLDFQYDAENDDYVAEVEIDIFEGESLLATIVDGEDVYFYVSTDEADLYEGDDLTEFVATDDEIIYVTVVSLSEATGEVSVIEPGSAPSLGTNTMNAGDFAPGDCPFDVPDTVDVRCGTLSVPENRLTNSGVTIQLAVAIIAARGGEQLPDPVFYLEGGPGGSALAGIDSWYNTAYRDGREIVILEQRGTGFSFPSLNCPEMDEGESTDAVEECRDRLLSEGVDLTAYNSRESAADVEALRLALGYDQINLYGISYGTRLALTVMRDYPAGIRAVVIDSVYPPNIDTNYNVTSDTYQLISLMFDDCAAQSVCAAAFPDLEARFYDHLDAIDAAPPLITDAEGVERELYPQDVIGTLIEQLMSTELVTAIPASLEALVSGDYETYVDLAANGAGDGNGGSDGDGLAQELAQELTDDELAELEALATRADITGIVEFLSEIFDLSAEELEQAAQGFVELGGAGAMVDAVEPPDIDDDSEGMNMSVQCYEEMPFMTIAEATARAEAVEMPELLRAELLTGTLIEFEQCALWPAGRADAIENAPVVSSIPTLILSARYDTATPPWWGDLAAETLSNGFNYHFPMVGHGVIDGGNCPVSIGLAFLSQPDVEPDTTCIAGMVDAFYVP